MIVDFVDHHGAEAWAAVRRTKGRCQLRDELLFAHAVDVPSKAHALPCPTEGEAVTVASEICVRVAGKQEHVITAQAKGETAIRAGREIEVRFIHDKKTLRGNHCVRGETEFLRHCGIVGEEPAPDVHGVRRRIEQLNRVESRR